MKNPEQSSKHWVIVFNWLTMGGAERQALLLAEELVRRGDRVSVVGFLSPGAVMDRCNELGIPCYHWPFSFAGSIIDKIRNMLAIAKQLRSLNPDYLVPFGMIPNLLCGIFWKYTGARASVWQQRDEGRARQSRYLEKLAIKLTPAFISNSEHAVEWLVGELDVPRKKIRVVKNGVVLEGEEGTKPSEREWERRGELDTLLVTMVANIHSYKDHRTLIHAWKHVIERYEYPQTLRLILAGNKQDTWPEIESYIRKNRLESYVDAIGSITEVPELIKSSSLIVHSSANEGVPNGILEGMALGKPIVGSDIPGIRETGIGEHPHQLFKVGDAESCAEKILYFLNNESDRSVAGAMNRSIIERDFGVQRMVDETISVFESAV